MTHRTKSKSIKTGNSYRPTPSRNRAKQALVIILLIGLVAAIMMQPVSPNTDANTTGIDAEPKQVSLEQAPDILPETQIGVLTQRLERSRDELRDIVGLSLFAPDPLLPGPEVDLRAERVQAIYGSSDHHAALVGKTIIRGGQSLPSGETVIEVTTDGVKLVP